MALLNVDFYSYYLGMDSPLTVLLPEKRGRKPEAAPDKKYPVLTCARSCGRQYCMDQKE